MSSSNTDLKPYLVKGVLPDGGCLDVVVLSSIDNAKLMASFGPMTINLADRVLMVTRQEGADMIQASHEIDDYKAQGGVLH